MNSATLQIAIEVDDKGSVKIRQLGQEARKAGTEGQKGFDGMKNSADQAEGSLGKLGNSAKIVGTAIAAIAASAVMAKVISESRAAVAAYADYEKQMLVLENQIVATGRVGQVTGKQLDDMAQRIDKATLESAAGVREAQGVLMSFRSIGTDSMERVLMVASDMVAVMGGDVVSATRSLARALEDPTQGLTMMARSGTTFTEQQKELIKSLHASGREMDAQNEILKVLESQYGGAAVAAGSGLAGAQDNLNRVSNNLRITIGEKLAPAVDRNTNALAEWIVRNEDMIAQGVEWFLSGLEWAWRKLYDVIVTAQGHFLTFMDIYISGLIQLEYVTQATWEVVKGSFGVALDAMRIMYAEFVEAIANSLPDFNLVLPVPGDTPFTMSFSGQAESLRAYAASVRDGATATGELQAKLAELTATRDREMAAHTRIVESMRAGNSATETAAKKTEELSGANNNLADTANQAGTATKQLGDTAKETSAKLATAAKEDEARLKDAVRRVQTRVDAERKAARDREQMEQSLTDRVKKMTLSELDYKRWALDQEVQELRKVAGEHEQTQALISQYHQGALAEIEAGNEATSQFVADRWKQAYDGMQGVLADWIFNWEISLDSMLDLFKRILAEMVAAWIMSGLAGMFRGEGLGGFSIGSLGSFSGGGSGGGSLSLPSFGGGGSAGAPGQGWQGTGYTGGQLLGAGGQVVGGAAGVYNLAEKGSDAGPMDYAGGALGAYSMYSGGQKLYAAYQTYQAAQALQAGSTIAAGASTSVPILTAGSKTAVAAAGTTPAATGAGAGAGTAGAGAGLTMTGVGAAMAAIAVAWVKAIGPALLGKGRDSGEWAADLTSKYGQSLTSVDNDLATAKMQDLERIFESGFNNISQYANSLLPALEAKYGEAWAGMTAALENSLPAFDRYLDGVLGVDVALEDSARVYALAQQATIDNGQSLYQLAEVLMDLGMSEDFARSTAVAMIASMDDLAPALSDSSMSAINAAQSLHTLRNVHESYNHEIGGYTSAMEQARVEQAMLSQGIEGSAHSIGAMKQAVDQLSNTPLDVSASIDVQLKGITADQYSASSSFSSMSHYRGSYNHEIGGYTMFADGGILTRAIEFRPGMIGGEAGYPEAIIPLRRPQQMNDIEDKLDDIRDRGDDRAILLAIARGTKKTADLLQRFEMIGLPAREARQ